MLRSGRVVVLCVAFVVSSTGCTGRSAEGVVLRGSAEKDFGIVKGASEPLTHEFQIENVSGRSQRIRDVKKSCGCLSAAAIESLLPPGAVSTISVSIDPRSVFGYREATARVIFEDVTVPSLALTVKAFVKPEYRVVVEPVFLTVPRDVAPGTTITTRLRATEFASHVHDYERDTRIEVTRSGHKIEEVSPWTPHGWRFNGGYARSTEFVYSYEVPTDWGYSNRQVVTLGFRKEGVDRTRSDRLSEVPIVISRM